MYKVILVDDEPAALEYIQRLIEKRCKDFCVSKTAGSGEEGLKLLESSDADVLISDIKMSGITGLEMIEKVKTAHPDLKIIIVSGYAEFDYARAAIQNAVIEYLLKPVDPYEFTLVMEKIKSELDDMEKIRRNLVFQNICNGIYVDPKEMQRYFPADEKYYAILIRKNNLPDRFKNTRESNISSDSYAAIRMYGRDENEMLYLLPESYVEPDFTLSQITENIWNKFQEEQAFCTMLVQDRKFNLEEMAKKIQDLYKNLNRYLVLGVNQKINLSKVYTVSNVEKKEKETIEMIEYFISQGKDNNANQELKRLCEELEQRKIPWIQAESVIRQICNFVWMNQGYQGYDVNIELILNDLFCTATSMRTIYQNISEILFPEKKNVTQKIDTPEFYEKVTDYLKNHVAEQLSLGKLVKIFGVSQSQLSYIFRKYAGVTFNNYLISLRMEIAKAKMDENAGILIRDVAQTVGYGDQFYFSRVFKMYTGMSPSEYVQKKEE